MKRIPEQENVKMELASDRINVNFGENNGFYVRASGGISCYGDTVYNDIYYALHDKITAASKMVQEYMNAMANAPPLTAIDFDMPYKKLAEFNGVVLGGIETENGEYNFTTWRKDNNSLYWGHYYGTDYTEAKEDFAARANLVNENKFFDSEMEKLEKWSEDVKKSLELELKNLDIEIKFKKAEARKLLRLEDKLNMQKEIKELEKKRNNLRFNLFEEQDKIDDNKEKLIEEIEEKMKQKIEVEELFRIKWKIIQEEN